MSQDIHVSVETGLLWMSPKKYAFFLANGKLGHDGKELYMHLQYTAILQETNSIKANDVYLMKGLGWGKKAAEGSKGISGKERSSCIFSAEKFRRNPR